MQWDFITAIVVVLGTAFGGWLLDRWLGIRAAIGNWWRSVRSRKSMTEAMVTSWPTMLEFISKAQTRDDTTAARDLRLTTEIQGFREHLGRQDHALDNISAQLWSVKRFSVQAEFQCDHTGRNVLVNAAHVSLMRVTDRDLLDYNWKNRVVEEDRRDYEAFQRQAFKEHRKFERTVRFQRGDGTCFRGRVRLEPYPEDPADLAQGREALWFGIVTVVEELT